METNVANTSRALIVVEKNTTLGKGNPESQECSVSSIGFLSAKRRAAGEKLAVVIRMPCVARESVMTPWRGVRRRIPREAALGHQGTIAWARAVLRRTGQPLPPSGDPNGERACCSE